ncbi:hypothetical protein [Actinomadura sp. 3N508]|uniref:hypothetical protein n=1 Tax=Actinomadura sp. 3N508 TaxID=3375153 RepID=UPI0037AD16CE
MGETSLTGYGVRRLVRDRYLVWRTERNRDTAMRYLDGLAAALERRGWRCVQTYRPVVVAVRVPLLRVYGADVAVTLRVLAMPGGGWGFHEARQGRDGFLCRCGDDVEPAARMIDRFLRDRPM